MKLRRTQFLIIIILAVLQSCDSDEINRKAQNATENQAYNINIDLPQIKKRGKLKALLNYSSTSYFIYRGRPMGFEYELLQRLANHLDVDLEIVVANNINEIKEKLQRGEADIIAQSLTVTTKRKKFLDFTVPTNKTRQVLVQRKPRNWKDLEEEEIEELLIRNSTELANKEIHVRKESSYYQRLQNLSDEIGADINIKEAPGNLQIEDLIRMVAKGKIDYTVADENLAQVQKTYYQNIDIKTPISLEQNVAWAVRPESDKLLAEVNEWLKEVKNTSSYNYLYAKYFKKSKTHRKRSESEFYSKAGGKISKYDDLIQRYAKKIDWDWRLLAAMVYQESRFNPKAESWMGARGLMQVMPVTGKHFGVTNLYKPENSVKAGIEYLDYLREYWSIIPDSTQRIKFIIASYNAGHGHVADARRLADKYGKDPNIWDNNVEKYILKKSKPKYFNDEVVKYGYVRGYEPYTYVKRILQRYGHYAQLIDKEGNKKDVEQTAWLQQ